MNTYPGADIGSDHNTLVMNFRFRRFKNYNHKTSNEHLDTEQLNCSEINAKVEQELEEELTNINFDYEQNFIETDWQLVKNRLKRIQDKKISNKQ